MSGAKNETESEMEAVSATIPKSVKRNIRVAAAQDGRTMAELMREILIEEFEE